MKAEYWLEISVTTDGEAAEAVSEYLLPFAYDNSVVLEQKGDPDSPDPMALESNVTVKIYVPGIEDSPSLREKIEEMLHFLQRLYSAIPAPEYRILEDEDWATAWRKNYHPFRLGTRIWIQPKWLEATTNRPDDIVILMDPGMAFGTGLHPTTQMCLQALEESIQPGSRVLDVGSGSGILSVAAAKLGAKEVTAFDIDPMAVEATVENALANSVGQIISVFQGSLPEKTGQKWDIVVVNILAPVIISLLRELQLLDLLSATGELILSGIIDDQYEDVNGTVIAVGGVVKKKLTTRDWICLVVRKK
ncbi:MAG TPA: 50S ribosomal protein L11 methyltransferase [Patescibacteria group bacterium]|nr:50S ribosomal protein L11 methyltransferase [Patescibacteria group bacterium]